MFPFMLEPFHFRLIMKIISTSTDTSTPNPNQHSIVTPLKVFIRENIMSYLKYNVFYNYNFILLHNLIIFHFFKQNIVYS